MRTITRKTNVRRHDRHLPSKVADVKKHQRTVTRQMLGTIPVKNLTYKQGKRIFPGLPANQDWDGDGVKNKKDCRPFDEERQHDDFYEEQADWIKNLSANEIKLLEAAEQEAFENNLNEEDSLRLKRRESFTEPEILHRKEKWKKEDKRVQDSLSFIAAKEVEEAEERARKASPLGDYDGDGVCNKDDCHPLDPNRQDDDEKEWRECKKCGYKVYDYPYSICPNCRRDWEEAFKKRDTRR